MLPSEAAGKTGILEKEEELPRKFLDRYGSTESSSEATALHSAVAHWRSSSVGRKIKTSLMWLSLIRAFSHVAYGLQ